MNNFVIKTVELAKYEDLDKNCLDLRTYNIGNCYTFVHYICFFFNFFFSFSKPSLWSYVRICTYCVCLFYFIFFSYYLHIELYAILILKYSGNRIVVAWHYILYFLFLFFFAKYILFVLIIIYKRTMPSALSTQLNESVLVFFLLLYFLRF